MKKIKKYNIDSFERLCNVINSGNFDVLTLDLLQGLAIYVDNIKTIREKYPEETKNKSNWDICEYSFTWFDDGKNDIKSINVINKQTGEIITKKINN